MTAKPGMVIGRSGDGIDAIKKDLVKLTGKEVEKLLDSAHITANKNTVPSAFLHEFAFIRTVIRFLLPFIICQSTQIFGLYYT